MDSRNGDDMMVGWKPGLSISAASHTDLQTLQRAGIECIEMTWRTMDIFESAIKTKCDCFVNEVRSAGMEVASVHIPFGTGWDPSTKDPQLRGHIIDKVARVLEFTKSWGVRTAVYHPSWEPIAADDRQERLDICKQTLTQMARFATDSGVCLAVECLPRTCLGNCADEIEFLVGDTAGLGICCDVNHLFKESPQQFIRRLGSRIVTTHISDNDGIDEKHWMPGNGVIEWEAVWSALHTSGYQGVFMYEVSNPDPQQVMDNYRELLSLPPR